MESNSFLQKIERWLLFDPEVSKPKSRFTSSSKGTIDVTVKGISVRWYRLAWNTDAPVILFAHGNGGSIDTRSHIISLFRAFGKANLVMFDYSGFGSSEGTPSQSQVLQDVLVVYDYLITGTPFDLPAPFLPNQIVGWGESFGGAVIAYLAEERPLLKGIVLMSTFPSLSWMVGKTYGFFMKMGFDRLCTDHLDTGKRLLETIRLPVVVLHSHDDDLIPIEAGIDLVRVYPSETTRLIVIAGTHQRPQISSSQFKEIWESLHTEVV